MNETKICRFCGEEVRAKAIKCRYCHSILDDKTGSSETEKATEKIPADKINGQRLKTVQNKNSLSQFLPMLLQTGLGIILMLIVWQVIVRLPMLEEISFPMNFTLTDLLAAAVLTIIVSMLISLGLRLELRLSYLTPNFPQGGYIIKQIIFLIAILIAYFAYRPIVVPYLRDLDWLYHLLFLIVFLTILAMLGSSVYRNMETYTEMFTSSKLQSPSAPNVLMCANCGEKNADGTLYCSFCGDKLPQPRKCMNCGTILKQDAKFCPRCGEVAEANGSDDETAQKAAQKKVCSSCSEPLKEDAKFCTSCGQPQN